MEKLEKSIKKRYLLFVSSIIIITLTALFIVQSSISSQILDSKLISVAGKQRVLAQRISKIAFSIGYDDKQEANINLLDNLSNVTKQWDSLQAYQQAINNKKENSETVAVLLEKNKSYLNKLSAFGKNVIGQSDFELLKAELENIAEFEKPYFENIDTLISEYQKEGEKNLKTLKTVIYSLAIGTFLLLLGGFLTVIRPAFKKFLFNLKEIKSSNYELEASRAEIKSNLSELRKLKTDLEIKEANNKIFIEQAPTAIAMLDTNMCYIAASKKWISDYKMEHEEIVGRCHYDLFPEIGDEWKANHQKCLNGAIDVCDEAPFVRLDGTVQWIYWDVRPWYISEGVVGGLIMHTGDITHIKQKEEEKDRIEKILEKTNEIARIGTWDVDLIKGTIFWSKVVFEIHELPLDYEPDLETAINFFKEGESRDAMQEAVRKAMEHGTSYDIELELVTANGKTVWTRAIGQAELVNGECVRIYGIFQDIDKIKSSELALSKAHTELKAIFNSGTIAIVSTNADGIINHFNHGAELLTGYSASEMIGLKRPSSYHLQEELDRFRIDIADLYGKDSEGFNAQLELSKNNAYDTREWTYLRKDGTTLPVQLTLTSIKDEEGELIGYLGVSTDVSEKRIAQNELLRKNQLLTFAEKITKMGNWQWDVVNNTGKLSGGMYEIYEVDLNVDTMGFDDFFKFVHPEDKEKVGLHAKASLENKVFENNFVHRIITAKGNVKIVQLLGEVITNEVGDVIEIIGTCQDITVQKMAENKFRGLLESAPDAMVITNEKGEIQLINKQAEKLFGYNIDELLGQSVEILIPQRFSGPHQGHRENYFEKPHVRSIGEEKELYAINKEGKEIPIQISLSPLETEQGVLVSAAIRDITAQKLAKSELLRKNHFLSFAERIAKMGNWQWNVVADTLEWSDNMHGIYGSDKNETDLNYYTFFNFVHPEDQDLVTKYIDEAYREKKFPSNFIHRIITTDGELKTVHSLGKVILDDQGEIIEMIGTTQDITEHKMAEAELLRKNHFLNFAERITKMGNWQWDVVTDTLKWSANLYGIFEHDVTDENLNYNTFFSYVHPDDKAFITRFIEDAFLEKKFPDNFIHRIVTSRGKIKTVHFLGEVILDDQGEIFEMIGTCQDVTEQKMEENKFRGLLESAPDAMVITDEASKIQMINKQAEKMFGYKIEELYNKSVDLLLPKRFLTGCEAKVDTLLGDLVGTESSGEEDLAAMNKEGKEFPVQITLSPLETEDGVLVSAAIRDITAQKLAKAELLRKNQLLTFAEKITMMGNWQWDLITNEVKWSANLYKIFGLDKDTELAYDTYFSSVYEDDKELVSKHVEQAIADKDFLDLTHRISLPDGSLKTIQLLAEVATDANGEVIEMTGTCQDVTAQKMAENKFRGLLESAPDAMVITNEDSLIQIINKQAELLFGYKIDEIYNKPIDLLLPIRSLEDHEFQRKSFLNKPKTTELSEGRDMFAINKNGREFPIQMSLSPLKTEEGMLISAVIRDVTDQKSAQNKIIKAKNDLEILAQKLIKNNNQLADFAHITSHNLRAPVSNLNSLLGLYNASVSEDDKAFLFEKFEKVINHLTVTLNTLVDAVKIKNNTPKEFEKLKFNDVLNKTKEILTGQIMKNEAIITSDFSEISKIKYDRIYLESIFLNLVGNSIKYRSKNRVPEIFIKSEIIDGKVRLFFQDNGLGIDLEKHGHKLFGLNKVFHRHPEAKGVGLFMVKTQVEALNGTIYATSKVNEGTTFYINFN
ncbi:PAS domain S-box-containing protein [Algibacter lectus]|uniref:PAS domain S-box protein n=1 Tax=Algibacter lectus TaxID=221126 RepID=UPI0008E88FAF|nr:PAS domain S-box protein [Algibacter lectus]SFD47210.1 PAS domain S-box-containing protein [Algibacter lectus]